LAGGIRPEARQLQFVHPPGERFEQLVGKLASAGIAAFVIEPPVETGEETHEKSKERAKRTYAQSVVVTKELMTSIRMGGKPNIKKVKRMVQGIVEQILIEETSLIGLTTIRDYDEYTFTHSINVCIFAVALGKRLGLTKLQLYDLGIAALFHDIGKSRVPAEVLNKVGGLTDDEFMESVVMSMLSDSSDWDAQVLFVSVEPSRV